MSSKQGSRRVTVAATQMACDWDIDSNIARAERLARKAADQGANVVLLQELFETPYFCIEQDPKHFAHATRLEDNPAIRHFRPVAKELGVVLPISFFERANHAFFNTVAMIDADGEVMGIYRKSHIPNGPGYQEKHYFNPGDTGFKVWDTRHGRIGLGICWDQWFPETARCMAIMGAEILLFPTAIGTEPPPAPPVHSREHWQRTQQGHAAANVMPLVASNRIGVERATQNPEGNWLRFYGSSFIADHLGAKVAEAPEDQEAVVTATFDLAEIRAYRENWGIYRDRRPDLYGPVRTLDGIVR
ncbi:MAG: N-carbamoylputrescine amidase [Dongiaceae bacterium]